MFHFQKNARIFTWCLLSWLYSCCSQHSHRSQWASAPLNKGRVRNIQHCTSSLVTECLEFCLCSLTSFPPESSKPDYPGYLLGICHSSQLTLPSFLVVWCVTQTQLLPQSLLCLHGCRALKGKKKKKSEKAKRAPCCWLGWDESCHSSERCCRSGTESLRSVSAKTGVSWWIITLADRTEISKKTQWQLLHRTILSGLLNTVIHCVNKDRQLHYAIVCY